MHMENHDRRYDKFMKHSAIFIILAWIPFSIYDRFMVWFEGAFCTECPWCKRAYPFWAKKKLKKCCAEKKKKYGPRPYLAGGGPSSLGGAAVYDRMTDTYRDYSGGGTVGRIYTRSDR